MQKQKIYLITTGGTIDKIYDEEEGSLANKESIIRDRVLSKLRLPHTEIEFFSIMSKDSLEMTDEDRELLALFIKSKATEGNPIVIIHGTDTMTTSAEYSLKKNGNLGVPIIFTGAMKPMGFEDSDAVQNVTEALLAAKIVAEGHYIAFHNSIFEVPKVHKDRERRTFVVNS